MLNETLVPFKFKGGRSYVHGTDIYDSMLEMVLDYFGEYPDSVKGSFHGLLKNNGIFRIYNSGEPLENEQLFGLFSILMKENMYQLVLLDAGTPISLYYKYDEQKVLENVVLKDETITMQFKSTYTYIEQIVSMTKKLHLTIYPVAKGKWLFTKILVDKAVDFGAALGQNRDLDLIVFQRHRAQIPPHSMLTNQTLAVHGAALPVEIILPPGSTPDLDSQIQNEK